MPIPNEVAKTISLIDAKVEELTNAKAALIAAFGGNGSSSKVAPAPSLPILHPPTTATEVEVRITRKAALRLFLVRNGPSTRAQIVAGLPDFPEGTLSFLLNAAQGFRRNSQGLWEVAE